MKNKWARPSIPREIKRRVLTAAGHRCSVCGNSCPLEQAHIIPWRESQAHSEDNLICLCANCHARADRENWGAKTLRRYKERPWILRQGASNEIENKRSIEIRIAMEVDDFDSLKQRLLLHALASFLELPIDAISIDNIRKGSTKVTVTLPADAAQRLVNAFHDKNHRLLSLLKTWPILSIALVANNIFGTTTREEKTNSADRSPISLDRDIGNPPGAMRKEGRHRPSEPRIAGYLTVDPQDIVLMRQDVANYRAFYRIYAACETWLHTPSTALTQEDYRDIVSQAIYENLDAFSSESQLPTADVNRRLLRSLSRLRSRALRETERVTKYKTFAEFEEAYRKYLGVDSEVATESEQRQMEKQFLNSILIVVQHMRLAVKALSSRDYAILYDIYKLDQFGFKEPALTQPPLSGLSKEARKVAIFRARRRFFNELEKLLNATNIAFSAEFPEIEGALKIVSSRHLEEWLRNR